MDFKCKNCEILGVKFGFKAEQKVKVLNVWGTRAYPILLYLDTETHLVYITKRFVVFHQRIFVHVSKALQTLCGRKPPKKLYFREKIRCGRKIHDDSYDLIKNRNNLSYMECLENARNLVRSTRIFGVNSLEKDLSLGEREM